MTLSSVREILTKKFDTQEDGAVALEVPDICYAYSWLDYSKPLTGYCSAVSDEDVEPIECPVISGGKCLKSYQTKKSSVGYANGSIPLPVIES